MKTWFVLYVCACFVISGCSTKLAGYCEPGEKNLIDILNPLNGETYVVDDCLKAERAFSADGEIFIYDNRQQATPIEETNAVQRALRIIVPVGITGAAGVAAAGM